MNYLFELLEKHLKQKDFRFIHFTSAINVRFKQGSYVFYHLPLDIQFGREMTPYEEFLHSIELFRVGEKKVNRNVHFEDGDIVETIVCTIINQINEDAKLIKRRLIDDFR